MAVPITVACANCQMLNSGFTTKSTRSTFYDRLQSMDAILIIWKSQYQIPSIGYLKNVDLIVMTRDRTSVIYTARYTCASGREASGKGVRRPRDTKQCSRRYPHHLGFEGLLGSVPAISFGLQPLTQPSSF